VNFIRPVNLIMAFNQLAVLTLWLDAFGFEQQIFVLKTEL